MQGNRFQQLPPRESAFQGGRRSIILGCFGICFGWSLFTALMMGKVRNCEMDQLNLGDRASSLTVPLLFLYSHIRRQLTDLVLSSSKQD